MANALPDPVEEVGSGTDPSIEAELLQQVAFHLPEREFYVLRHRERYRSRAAETLLALVVRSPAGGIG